MIMIKVKFFTLLRLYLGIEEVNIETDQIDVKTLLREVGKQIDSNLVREKLLDPDGDMLQGTIILINGHDILHMEKLDTIGRKGDSVSLFTPGGGG